MHPERTAAASGETHGFEPGTRAFIDDPYPAMARLREDSPLYACPRLHAWVVTRYDDTRSLLADPRLSSSRLRPFFDAMDAGRRGQVAALMQYLTRWMVFTDPPEHTRLRGLVAEVFNATTMNAMRPVVERRVDALLHELRDRDEIDFIADFAGPLPALVIMDMLGVPAAHLARIKDLSDQVALFIGSARITPDKYARAEAATREMADFFRGLIDARRQVPHDDALGRLVALAARGDGSLTEDELVATCILMLFAGHETTTNHIANGLRALIDQPDQLALLRDRPELIRPAVEELLRFDGPSLSQTRVAAQAITLHGREIGPGDRVFLMLGAANRDPRAFEAPDRVDIARERRAHLAFGWGPHICLGFPLARLEGQVALPRVLDFWPRISNTGGPVRWLDSLVFRGMTSMPLAVARG